MGISNVIARPLWRLVAQPEQADNADEGEARRFATHLTSLTATKSADGLIDPKLVLAWLLSALGAPGYLIGALTPVREAGALLPQLALSRWVEAQRIRKWFWVGGAALQGLAALGIAGAAIVLDGAAAGWAIVGCLAVFAVARSSCSTSYKDVLARTVAKGSRGALTGAASGVGAAVLLAFAAALSFGVIPRTPDAIAAAIAVAGALWLMGALIFATLDEPPAEKASDGEMIEAPAKMARPLFEDGELRTYIAARALLISTALAPPFLVMASHQESEGDLGQLGPMLIATALASILSAYVWGRLSDRSSRKTLMAAGAVASVALGAATVAVIVTGGLFGAVGAACFVFVAQIAYEGARAGRKVHLTDMDAHGRRTLYTALSNTLIGALLIVGGGAGVLAEVAGPEAALALFAVLSLAAVPVASRLSEVQQTD